MEFKDTTLLSKYVDDIEMCNILYPAGLQNPELYYSYLVMMSKYNPLEVSLNLLIARFLII